MDTSVLTFIVAISGSIITLLLLSVSYFIKKFIGKVDELTTAVNHLCSTVDGSKIIQANFERNCNNTHFVVNKRLDDHASRIDKHEGRLIRLEK